MIIIYKNRGILVPVYFIVSIVFTIGLNEFFKEHILDIEYDFQIVFGLGSLISALWTFLKSEDFIEVNGEKEKVNFDNSFFFIPMKLWSKIMFVSGILIITGGILETIDKLNNS